MAKLSEQEELFKKLYGKDATPESVLRMNSGYSQKALTDLSNGTYAESRKQIAPVNNAKVPSLSPSNGTGTQTTQRRFGSSAPAYNQGVLGSELPNTTFNPNITDYIDVNDKLAIQNIAQNSYDGRYNEFTKDKWDKGSIDALERIAQKYGKSADEMMSDYYGVIRNNEVEQAKAHPILNDIGSVFASPFVGVEALLSAGANSIDSSSRLAQKLENDRQIDNGYITNVRDAVKENTGDKGDKVIDTVNQLADRTVASMIGKAAGGVAGNVISGILAGGVDTNRMIDEYMARGASREEASRAALVHGTIEGIGTGLVTGAFDKRTAKTILGELAKSAGSGAVENMASQFLEDASEMLTVNDKSLAFSAYDNAIANGQSHNSAIGTAVWESAKSILGAGAMGALFGASMKGLDIAGKKGLSKLVNATFDSPSADGTKPINVLADATDKDYDEILKSITDNALGENKLPSSDNGGYFGDGSKPINFNDNLPRIRQTELDANWKRDESMTFKRAGRNIGDGADRYAYETGDGRFLMYQDSKGYVLSDSEGEIGTFRNKKEVENFVNALYQKESIDAKYDAEIQARRSEYAPIENPTEEDYNNILNNMLRNRGGLNSNTEIEPTRIPNLFDNNGTMPSLEDADPYGVRQLPRIDNYNFNTEDAPTKVSDVPTVEPQNVAPTVDTNAPFDANKAGWRAIQLDETTPKNDHRYEALGVLLTGEELSKSDIRDLAKVSDEQLATLGMTRSQLNDFVARYDDANGTNISAKMPGTQMELDFETGEAKMPTDSEQVAPVNDEPTTDTQMELDFDNGTAKMPNETVDMENSTKVPTEAEIPQKPTSTPVDSEQNVKPTTESNFDSSEPYPTSNDQKVKSFSRRGSEYEKFAEITKNQLAEDVYGVAHNKDTIERANSYFDADDLLKTRSTFDELVNKRDPASIVLGYDLANELTKQGKYSEASDVVMQMSEHLTRSGQFTQAASLAFMRNDPMAAMTHYQKALDSVNRKGREQYGKKWNDLKLTEDDMKAFSDIKKGDADAILDLQNEINKRFRKDIPSDWWEKVVGASKVAMLLNPKTQEKNVLANVAMLPMKTVAARVDALGQNIVHLVDSDAKVTQSLTGGTIKQKKIASQVFENIKDTVFGDSKYKEDLDGEILGKKQLFKDDFFAKWIDNLTNGGIQKLNEKFGADANQSTMETLRNFTYWLMDDIGDKPFVKLNFVDRLASYMKAQGIDNIDDIPEDAIAIATQEALKATFKDDNAFTELLRGAKKNTGKFGEVMLPFTKTPANLAMRSIDYSPVGLVNAFRQIKSGKDLSTVMGTISKSITGTAAIMLGAKLKKEGIITGSYSSDKDESAFQKQQGMKEYAFKINGKYYPYDWAQPSASALIIGTVVQEAIDKSDEENKSISDYVDSVYKGGLKAANAWLGLSPLQSLSDMLGGSGNEDGTAGSVMNEIIEFPQRLIPSLSGSIARITDPVMRDTYTKDDTIKGTLKNQLNSAMAKIPGLSKTLPVSYDTWGNPRTRYDSTSEAIKAELFNPSYPGKDNSTELDPEISRLFEQTNNNAVFPKWASRNPGIGKIVDGKVATTNKNLTNEEHSEYQKRMGQLSYKFANAIMSDPQYNSLDDEAKASMLGSAYNFADRIAKEELFGHETTSDKELREAFGNGDIKNAVKHLYDSAIAKSIGVSKSTYDKYGYEGSIEKQNAKAEAEQLGLTESQYEKAQEYKGGAQQYSNDLRRAESYGFSDIDNYNNAKEIFGGDVPQLKEYNNYKKQWGNGEKNERYSELTRYSWTDEQKAKAMFNNNPSNIKSESESEIYNSLGWNALWEYEGLIRQVDGIESGKKDGKIGKKEWAKYTNTHQNLNEMEQVFDAWLKAYGK